MRAEGRLTRYGASVDSVFDLLGVNENDLTAALGYTLAHAPALLDRLLLQLFPGVQHDHSNASIALEVRDTAGRTDLEITLAGALLVVEAKRGWLLPGRRQLAVYGPRIKAHGGGALITLSRASSALARLQLPRDVDGIPVVHLPWGEILAELDTARRSSRGHERIWLEQLKTYLEGAIRVRDVADGWTYCVVLNNQRPGGGGAPTFQQYVVDEHAYFHPYGVSGWPVEPPNFMAFRWRNAVQRIHRVVHADVVPSLTDRWPDIPATDQTTRPHAIYDLGPQLPPHHPIPSGATYRAGRLWVFTRHENRSSRRHETWSRPPRHARAGLSEFLCAGSG